MTRGNQREIDRARAQARQAKYGKKDGAAHGDRLTQQMSDADKMREKQRLADLKKQGKLPEEAQEKKKEFDDSYLKQFENLDVGDDDKFEEEKQGDDEAAQQQQAQDTDIKFGDGGKKVKKDKKQGK